MGPATAVASSLAPSRAHCVREVLEVIHREVSVSYRLRWADGNQTLIAPTSGTARTVRASKRA
jgi:hypothetical protein